MTQCVESPIIIESHEQCVCTRCEGAIPRENVEATILRGNPFDPPRQVVMAYCGHCREAYSLTRVLQNGTWVLIGAVNRMTGPCRSRFLSRIGRLKGDRQIHSAE